MIWPEEITSKTNVVWKKNFFHFVGLTLTFWSKPINHFFSLNCIRHFCFSASLWNTKENTKQWTLGKETAQTGNRYRLLNGTASTASTSPSPFSPAFPRCRSRTDFSLNCEELGRLNQVSKHPKETAPIELERMHTQEKGINKTRKKKTETHCRN